MERNEWPTIEEVNNSTMEKLSEWMRDLVDPQTEEEVQIQEEISKEYVERCR